MTKQQIISCFLFLWILSVNANSQSQPIVNNSNAGSSNGVMAHARMTSEGNAYLKTSKSETITEEKIESILQQLTIEEKVRLCHGQDGAKTASDRFISGGVPRLNIKPIKFYDGPVGVRVFDTEKYQTTSLPSTILLACSWDKKLARQYGNVIASEMLSTNAHVLFAPGVNLMRSPLCGRNFEYMGEDPFLTGLMGSAFIKGVQDNKVAACSKHLLANYIEEGRHYISSNMNERTLREIYLIPFEKTIKSGNVWTIMTGNNIVNGVHMAEHRYIINDILKEEMGYDGVILTDWRSAYNTIESAKAGVDMTTGVGSYVFGEGNLLQAVNNNVISEALINEKARRVLRLYSRTGLLNQDGRKKGEQNTKAHQRFARKAAAEGMVLLKNNTQLLPISLKESANILLTGPGAATVPAGSGSSDVNPPYKISLLDAMESRLGDNMKLSFISYNEKNYKKMEKAASEADNIVFAVTAPPGGEGNDFENLELTNDQSTMISKLAEINPNITVVLLTAALPVNLQPWKDKVGAILASFYSGQSTGDAILDILSGEVCPGGKLSFTWGEDLMDYPPHALDVWEPRRISNETYYGGRDPEKREDVHIFSAAFKEGIFVGYRWFDQKLIEPDYAFGHGLSYTSFQIHDKGVEIKDNSISSPLIHVNVSVKNTGKVKGSEVVQVYLEDKNASVERPPRELKGFQKVFLDPGEEKTVSIQLDLRSFAFWSIKAHEWIIEPGKFVLNVGNSSRNFAYKKIIDLK